MFLVLASHSFLAVIAEFYCSHVAKKRFFFADEHESKVVLVYTSMPVYVLKTGTGHRKCKVSVAVMLSLM